MNREQYKPKRKGQPKRKDKLRARKSRMLKVAQEWKPNISPKLREAYSTKIEWVRNVIPKLKEEAEAR
jgi:hypothetical protein